MPLTEDKLKTLKPRQKPYEVADSHVLCVEVMPSGTRAGRYRYRLNGKREKPSFGT